jgi:hypothetical protein
MKISNSIALGLLVILASSCSTGYINEGDAVYYENWNEGSGQNKRKIDANPKSFIGLHNKKYGKDDKFVFYEGEKIIGADAKTFELLNEVIGRDKNYGWYEKDTINNSYGPTMKAINYCYSTDGKDVFYMTKPLHMVEPKNFTFVKLKDDDKVWTTDGKYYYYYSYKIPSDDYRNVKLYPNSGGLSKDKRWVYFLDHTLNYDIDGNKVVDTIDVESFNVTGFLECRDKYGCFNPYHGREQCTY